MDQSQSLLDEYNETSYVVDSSQFDSQGFCDGYELRRHRCESEANLGAYEARRDWLRSIGPIDEFGNANPYHGDFTSVVLPFTIPDRVRLCAYAMEYAFIYDNVLESAKENLLDDPNLSKSDAYEIDCSNLSITGAKQLESKIILSLMKKDKLCGQQVMQKWKEAVLTTDGQKQAKPFTTMDQYLDFRHLDSGAAFVRALIRFGMGLTFTDDEEALLKPLTRTNARALCLANDYVSFERELDAYQNHSSDEPINAVWLCMKWDNVDAATAKERVKSLTLQYEADFVRERDAFLSTDAGQSRKLQRYLQAMTQQIPGNLVWSLSCPRYHAERRYDPNAGAELDFDLQTSRPTVEDLRNACKVRANENKSSAPMPADGHSPDAMPESSEVCEARVDSPVNDSCVRNSSHKNTPSSEHVSGPIEYTLSHPSKGVRDALADALNVWLGISPIVLERIKRVIRILHNASLMLDDIEDCSPLRRGKPAAHTVFGVPATLNAANFAILEAMEEVCKLPEKLASLEVFTQQMRELYVGQSYDLHWSYNNQCPTEKEYLHMVEQKTGGLFVMLARLMQVHSSSEEAQTVPLQKLLTSLGQYFQIRDDQRNLTTSELEEQKGFCEDLDEGKFSYPIVLALQHSDDHQSARAILRQILTSGKARRSLSKEMKLLALEQLGKTSSLEATKAKLESLYAEAEGQLSKIEQQTGRENWIMRLLLWKLSL
ncbi:hypothetical protein BAUCODRAFT_513498 [Baudoinia panamericana UAMH 10762]|uniref:Uncharacterized protein n=2 Tax=Baudoinia panamericana TaxID=1709381 RepID=M2MHF5_BAUPA|nr:uncharacterized protein BAUCODRAFT_513498 [Baudoinia panamericana UAMH 10762]EMC96021.1 hypothetical protein BAUCODRAFT_513498 [Baudoinia panamericana UAMH 10762]QXF69104.1 variediene [Baudoinia panamericana]